MAPITDPSLPPCTSNAAERTTACCQPLSPTSSRSPARRLLSVKEPTASRSGNASARDCPRAKLWAPPTPSVGIAAALASTRAERPLKVVAAVGRSPAFEAEQLRARRPLTFTRQTLLRLNLLQLQRSAGASEKTLQPAAGARGKVATASCLTPCRPAQASNRCVASARVSLRSELAKQRGCVATL